MPSTAARFGVVVGVDGSPECFIAVRWAAHEAQMRDIPITLVYFLTPALREKRDKRVQVRIDRYQRYVGGRMLDEASRVVEECCGDAGTPTIKREQFYALPVPALAAMSKDAHMVVIGSHGRGGFSRMLFGSVSSAVAHAARTPVIVARG